MSSFRVLLPQLFRSSSRKLENRKQKKKYWICWTILNKLKEEEVKHCSEISFKLYIKRSERSGEKTCRKMVKNWNWNLFRFSINYKLVKRSETNTHPHRHSHTCIESFLFLVILLFPVTKKENNHHVEMTDTRRHTLTHIHKNKHINMIHTHKCIVNIKEKQAK